MAELDTRQQAAVSAGPVELFVTAGAGSGKTRVLSARFVAAVLGEPPYSPCRADELVAVTYTEKAAGELAERIRGALSAAGETSAARSIGEAWISTIHGMCSRILRQHALTAGIDPQFAVLDEVEASALEAEAVEEVVRELLAADSSFGELLDLYGPAAILGGAQMLRSNVCALGRTIADVGTVTAEEAIAQLREARKALAEFPVAFAALRQTKTVEGNAEALRRLIEGLDACGDEAPLGEICACSLRHLSSVEGHDELVEACLEWVERARQAAAQLLVSRHEAALLAFAEALEERYRALKDERGALDFEDLQVKTAELLERSPDVAAALRDRFAMVMLDEFQDTNELQLRIVEQLSRDNLCTVGDENQSIYAFRHADVEVFRARAREAISRAELDTNYRTAPPLLDALNGLFSHPALLGPGFLRLRAPEVAAERRAWPASEARLDVRCIDTAAKDGSDPQDVEAQRIAERVGELVDAGVAAGDIAILMRAMSGGRAVKVEDALAARGIPAYIASGGSFFDRHEVMEARALLRCIANVWDDDALAAVLAGHLTRMSIDGLVALRARADELAAESGRHRRDARLWEAAVADGLQLAPDDARALRRTVAAIEEARSNAGSRPLATTVLEALLTLDADLVLLSAGRGGTRAWSNLLKLARMAGEFEAATAGDMAAFLEYLDLRELHAASEQEATVEGESSAVRVMSIHSAKGLEFPFVIVAGLSSPQESGPIVFGREAGRPMLGMTLPWGDKALPTIGSARLLDAVRAGAAAESVRLLYVACTRAEEGLTLIARTDAEKDAGKSLGDLVRTALGFAGAQTLADGTVPVGDGEANLRILPSTLTLLETAADEPSEVHPDDHPEDILTTSAAPSGGKTTIEMPRQISYSALATYGRCPRRFFLASIAHLPAPPQARGGDALAFGNALHDVLERCKSRTDDPATWTEQAAKAASLSAGDVPRLLAAARAFLDSPRAEEVFSASSSMCEAAIAVPLGDTVLAGSIDRIAWFGDEALILDYKTGAAQLPEAEARERYLLQASCYALAAFRAGASGVRVVFAEVERGREIAYEFAASDAPEVEADVSAVLERMQVEGYTAHASYDADLCETCPGLGGLCPVSRPTRDGAA